MAKKVEILGVEIDNITINETREKVAEYLQQEGKPRMIVTPNSEMLVRAWDDNRFADILNRADLKVPDGSGLLLAAKILKNPLQERVAGIDLMKELLQLALDNSYSVYLLGGEPEIIDKAVNRIKTDYVNIDICGYHHGYLNEKTRAEVIENINRLKPDILFVGMGVPLQENFLAGNLKNLTVKVALTVGGSFDIFAGKIKRAPVWMQESYLEWLYRLWKEPTRIVRIMAIPRFIFLIFLNR